MHSTYWAVFMSKTLKSNNISNDITPSLYKFKLKHMMHVANGSTSLNSIVKDAGRTELMMTLQFIVRALLVLAWNGDSSIGTRITCNSWHLTFVDSIICGSLGIVPIFPWSAPFLLAFWRFFLIIWTVGLIIWLFPGLVVYVTSSCADYADFTIWSTIFGFAAK